MIGLVLVSHSHDAAEGTAMLARQMAGSEVSIATAGGLDDGTIGTDAMRVLAAIEQAWSDDGVLVLMDLGSAVLSTEMALDFLDPTRAAAVRLSGAPFVEGAVAAAVAAKLGLSLEEVDAEAHGGLAGKTAHLGDEAHAEPAAVAADADALHATARTPLPARGRAWPPLRAIARCAGCETWDDRPVALPPPANARALEGGPRRGPASPCCP